MTATVPSTALQLRSLVQPDGTLTFSPGHSVPGSTVVLRMEMNVLVILNTCQHPFDPDSVYRPRPVKLEVLAGEAPGLDDPSFTVRPENLRAWENNETYHALRF